MYFNANGQPDPNGRFQLIDGRLKLRDGVLRDGEQVTFSHAFMDSVSTHDAKSDPPKSIDEALRQRFAEMAKQQQTTVKELLASMEQTKIEETAADVAKAFISAQAGQGVASTFATDSVINDAERNYAVARARRIHDMHCAHLPESQRPVFTAGQAEAAVTDALTAKVRARAAQMVLAADRNSDPSFQRGIAEAQSAARKHVLSNAWRA